MINKLNQNEVQNDSLETWEWSTYTINVMKILNYNSDYTI